MEVLASFKFDKHASDFNQEHVVHFSYLGKYYSLSLTRFMLLLDLYTSNFVNTMKYSQLVTDFPLDVNMHIAY